MSEKIKFLYDEDLDNPATSIRVYNTNETKDLVLKAFYQQDFNMTITNRWNTGDLSMAGQLVNSVGSMVTSRDGRMLTEFMDSGLKSMGSTGDEEGDRLKSNMSGMVNKLQEYQHAHIFSAEEFFKTFKGSNVTFPLNLSVSLLSDEINSGGNKDSSDIFIRLSNIIKVTLGDYLTADPLGFVGIQKAPNGFKSKTFNLAEDANLDGSLVVVFGDPLKGGFTLNNMLMSSVQVTFSKTQVEIRDGVFRPLYIDVQVMLEPGKKFTKTDIEKNLGLPKGSTATSKNFIYKEKKKKTVAEITSEEGLKKLDQEVLDFNAAEFQLKTDFGSSVEGVNLNISGSELVLHGEVTQAEFDIIMDTLNTIDMGDYPDSVHNINVENLHITN